MSNISVSISADTAQMTAQLAVAKADLSAFSANLRDLAAQMRDAGAGASDELKAGLSQAAAAAAGAQSTVSGLQAKLRAARQPMDELSKAGEHQAGIFREKMVMAHEALMGNYSRMAGSMMVLTERTGGFGGALGTLVNPMMLTALGAVAIVGGFAKMVTASEDAERESNKLRTAFAAVGHSGMMTGQQITNLVDHVASLPGVNREAADQIIESFARSRQIGGQLLGSLTTDIDKSARAMGIDAPAAAKTLATAFSDPARGARELDQQYDILTAAQLRQIETLQAQGDRIGAQNILLDAWNARLASIPADLTAIQNSTNSLANAWDNLTKSIGNTSVWINTRGAIAGLMDWMAEKIGTIPLEAKIDSVTAKLQRLKSTYADSQSINEAQKELTDLQAQKAAQDALNAATQKGKVLKSDNNDSLGERRQEALKNSADSSPYERIQHLQQEINNLKDLEKGADGEDLKILQARVAMKEQEKETLIKSQSKDQPGQMEQWRAELTAKQNTLAEMHAADVDYARQGAALELQFWTEKVALAKAGSKEQLEAQKSVQEAQKRLYELDAHAAAEANKKKQAIERSNTDANIQMLQKDLAATKDELDAEVSEHQISAAQRVEILKAKTSAEQQAELAALDAEIAHLKEGDLAYAEAMNRRKLLLADFAIANAKLDRDLATADKQAAAESTKAWEEATAPIGRAFDGMVSGVLQGTQTIGQASMRMAGNIVISFAEAIGKMLMQFGMFKIANALGWTQMAAAAASSQSAMSAAVLGKETAMTAATVSGNAARTAADESGQAGFLSRVGVQIAQWLGLESGKTAETVAGNASRDAADATAATAAAAAAKAQAVAEIPSYAAIAAAGAMASVAAIPVIGWAMAPEVGEATFGEAMAFLPMASAAGGWDRVPYDGALTELHKDEMVLPASIAGPLRSLTSAMGPAVLSAPNSAMPTAANFNGGAGVAGSSNQNTANSNVQVHYAPVVTVNGGDAQSSTMFQTMLNQHSRDVLKAVNQAVANGGNVSIKR